MTTLNETRTGSALTDDEIRAKYEAPFRHGAGMADSRAKRLAAAHFIESLREDGIPISRACRTGRKTRSCPSRNALSRTLNLRSGSGQHRKQPAGHSEAAVSLKP